MGEVFKCSEKPDKVYPISEYLDTMRKKTETIASSFRARFPKKGLVMTYGTYADALKVFFHPGDRDLANSKHYFLRQAIECHIVFVSGKDDLSKRQASFLARIGNELSIEILGEMRSMAKRFKMDDEELEGVIRHILAKVEYRGRVTRLEDIAETYLNICNPYSRLFR